MPGRMKRRREAAGGDGGELAITSLLCLLLSWAPLPFASITRGGQVVVQVGAFAILALGILTARSLQPLRAVAFPAAAIAAIGLMGLLQSLPWSARVVSLLSPEHGRLAAEAAAAAPGGARTVAALSLAPAASRATALTWLAAAAVMACAALVGGRTAHRRALGATLLGSALLQVLFGTRHFYANSPTMWGVVIAPATHLRGTFVNPDQSATYLLLALAVAFAWWWLAVGRSRGATLESVLLQVSPPTLIWITLFVAVAFTGSRGALIAAAFGATSQGILMSFRHRRWQAAPVAVLAVLVGLAAVAGVGMQQGLGKWMSSTSHDASWGSRVRVYGLTLELWSRFPWTGTGLGTFRDSFTLVQPADLEGGWWHAHSNPLELLATTGIAGAVTMIAGTLAMLARLARTLRRAGSREERIAALAALGAMAAVALHESIDFGLAMPATAVSLAALCGASAAAGRSVPSAKEGDAHPIIVPR